MTSGAELLLRIALESPDQPDVRQLIADLDAYQDTLYPPECRYVLDIAGLLEPRVRFVVSRDAAGAAVACGALVLQADHAEVKRLYVVPSWRRHGAARAVLSRLEQEAGVAGCSLVCLETGPLQPEALSLYDRLGYARRGPFGNYREDAMSVFMEKRLSR